LNWGAAGNGGAPFWYARRQNPVEILKTVSEYIFAFNKIVINDSFIKWYDYKPSLRDDSLPVFPLFHGAKLGNIPSF